MTSERTTTLASKIESLLFLHGEPLPVSRLAKALSADESAIAAGLETLSARYAVPDSGIMLVRKGSSVELVTNPENAPEVESMLASDREETLGKATLETLSVIAYRGPVSRAAIDAIRGVNSSFSLRNLSLRGLVERKPNPLDAREYEYVPSFRLFESLGIGSAADLPGYASLSRGPEDSGSGPDSVAEDGAVTTVPES